MRNRPPGQRPPPTLKRLPDIQGLGLRATPRKREGRHLCLQKTSQTCGTFSRKGTKRLDGEDWGGAKSGGQGCKTNERCLKR